MLWAFLAVSGLPGVFRSDLTTLLHPLIDRNHRRDHLRIRNCQNNVRPADAQGPHISGTLDVSNKKSFVSREGNVSFYFVTDILKY